MKKFTQKVLAIITAFVMGLGLVSPITNTAPAYAAEEKKGAAILTGCWDAEDGGGEGIKCVVLLVVNVLSVLVGVIGIIGIVVVGIQYLTAGGSEEQTRKAKRRLFEIIIGIVAYAIMAAFLNWLLPGFNTSSETSTNSTSSLYVTGA